jgi:hypothetical protein
MEITKFQWKTLSASFLGYCLDSFDWMQLSFVMPLVMASWGDSQAAKPVLLQP